MSLFQQGFGCSISHCWSSGFVFFVSDCDTLIGSLFDVLLAYLQSPNTSPTVSIELGRDPSLLANPLGCNSEKESDCSCFLAHFVLEYVGHLSCPGWLPENSWNCNEQVTYQYIGIKASLPPPAVKPVCFPLFQVLKKTFQATSKWLVHLQGLPSNSQQQQTEKILEGNKAGPAGTNSDTHEICSCLPFLLKALDSLVHNYVEFKFSCPNSALQNSGRSTQQQQKGLYQMKWCRGCTVSSSVKLVTFHVHSGLLFAFYRCVSGAAETFVQSLLGSKRFFPGVPHCHG